MPGLEFADPSTTHVALLLDIYARLRDCFRAGRLRGEMSMTLRRGFIHPLDMPLTQKRASAPADRCR
jgi:hypothetical protein